jgi:hypothetical protein
MDLCSFEVSSIQVDISLEFLFLVHSDHIVGYSVFLWILLTNVTLQMENGAIT